MPMKLKVAHLYEATLTLALVIRENRPMTQKGKYWAARMHSKLLPDWTVVNEQREAFINAFNHMETGATAFSVPADKMPEWHEFWTNGLAKEVVEVDVKPLALSMLMLDETSNGSITAAELISLDDLVYDDSPVDIATAA